MIFKLRNQDTKQATPVPPGEHSVGREDFNYIHINEASVSRRHARLINSNEGIFVEDLGSANGTALRGRYITGLTEVSFGDLIYFGQAAFAVEPEVPGEDHQLPSRERKNPNPKGTRFRRATEKLPVGHIQFEDSVPTAAEKDIGADKRNVEIHEPQPLGAPAGTASLAAAATAAPAKPSAATSAKPAPAHKPAPAPVFARQTDPPPPAKAEPAFTSTAAPTSPLPVPSVEASHAAAAERVPPGPNVTVVSLNTAIVLAGLAGLGIGAVLGYLLATFGV
ncbi:MAG: FHA domain-containing protein [Verrucomicrobiota bacterium]